MFLYLLRPFSVFLLFAFGSLLPTMTNHGTRSKRKRDMIDIDSNIVTPSPISANCHLVLDANDFLIKILLEMQCDSVSRFSSEVDFRNCPISYVDILFPKQSKYGEFDPPECRKINGRSIRKFRKFGRIAQKKYYR